VSASSPQEILEELATGEMIALAVDDVEVRATLYMGWQRGKKGTGTEMVHQ